jgi:hypothetical protein
VKNSKGSIGVSTRTVTRPGSDSSTFCMRFSKASLTNFTHARPAVPFVYSQNGLTPIVSHAISYGTAEVKDKAC